MSTSIIPTGIPPDEQERLADLRGYEILETAPEASFDILTQVAAYVFHTAISAISLVDENRVWFKSKRGIEVAAIPRDVSFSAHAIRGNDVFVVRDARADARFAANPLVAGPPYVRFYAGALLRSPKGYNLGTLCVMEQNPRDLSDDERNILAGLSKIVIDELELRRKSSDLDDEAYRLRVAEETAQLALARFEQAEYDLVSARVARELKTGAPRDIERTAMPSPWPSSSSDE